MRVNDVYSKADPVELRKIRRFEDAINERQMDDGVPINARFVHSAFSVKEPFPLWWSRKLTHFKEFRDYVRDADEEGRTVFVTTDVARVMALGNASQMGAIYSVLTSARIMKAMPGVGIFEMMDHANERWDENERLDRLFSE